MSMQTIGRYEIVREVGRGGMATVYLATDPAFKRQVAIKVLPPQFTHDPQFRVRFEREAQVIAALEHAYIVPVYDFGQHGDQPFIVMRYLSGGTLGDHIEKGPMPLADVVPIVQRVAEALNAAHRRGVIHRDLKPGNILFDGEGQAFLSDFGIAKLAQEAASLTGTGLMVGTPEYMSPEQAMGQKTIDHRSDIYALGVITYEMITGRHPYEADTPVGLMLKHVTDPVPSLDTARYGLPAECGQVLARALAKKPDDRFASADQMAQALQGLGAARTVVAPRPTVVARPAPAAPPPAPATPQAAPPARPVPVVPRQPEKLSRALAEIPCRHCGGAGLHLQDDGSVTCRFCGLATEIAGVICPNCEHANLPKAEHCANCQEALVRYCPSCQAKNWSGLEACTACGSRLDALAYLTDRWMQGQPEYKLQQQASVKALKAEEEAASQRRMAQMMEAEERRQKEIQRAMAQRAARERQIMQGLFIFLVVAGVITVVAVLIALK